MQFIKALTIVFILSLLAIPCIAQTSPQFQSVGGDFGKSWITSFQAQNQPAANDNLKNDLWSWGTAPKGKTVVGGKLVDTPNATNTINFTANWLGDFAQGVPIYINSTTPYGNYGRNPADAGQFNSAPLTPLSLSDDPWVLAQQLERPIVAPAGYYGNYYPPYN
ncbi:MAG: hypothetical protein ACE14P_00850 [Methanotrichaceae archaeon]